jgi:hypothetical protein
MGKGLAYALLLTSREVFKGATPVDKITTPGFLNYLLTTTSLVYYPMRSMMAPAICVM